MNYFHGKTSKEIFKIIAKTACVFLAVFTLAIFNGCDLIDSIFGNGGEDQPEDVVTISRANAQIEVGGSITLTATSSEDRDIEWFSDNEKIAVVDDGGKVTGIGAGTTAITASDGKKTAQCMLTVTEPEGPGYKLVWSDEFDGNSLDMTKWSYMTGTQDHYGNSWGAQYWGNDERQYYTDGANLKVSDGALQITAKREAMGDRDFTSARISTRDNFSQTYGYFEARMKTPAIDGMWPAFWMLPQPPNKNSTNNEYGGWPNNGEIDIMEAKGRLKNVVDCTLHYGRGWEDANHMMNGNSPRLSSNTDADWHTYAVDWREDYIAWIVDGKEVHRVKNSQWWTGSSSELNAPFDKPFYVLLNLAVGGKYDNYVNPPADFREATMYVDYVRVYEFK